MTTHKKIAFFSDEITLRPHTASAAELLDKPMKDLREWLLPKCVQADLNSDTFEYLAAYLAKKLELKS